MAPLDQFANMAKEPQLGDREKIEQSNNEYNKPLNVSLEEQKKDVLKDLYGVKSTESVLALNTDNMNKQPEEINHIKDAREITDVKELEIFLEHPYYPIIERFAKLPGVKILNSDMIEIARVLNDKTFEEIDVNTLNEGNIDKNLKNYLSNYLLKIQELNPKQEDKEIQDIEIPKEFDSVDVLQDKNNDIVQLLAKNYIRIPDGKEGSPDFTKDIETTFEITLNKLIDGKQFPKSESYDLAVKDIKTGDIETKFKALTYINSLVNTSEGLKGKKANISYDKIKGEHNTKKQEYLEFKSKQLEKQLKEAESKGDRNKIEELKEQINKIEEEKSSGDIFESGDLDSISDIESNLKEQA